MSRPSDHYETSRWFKFTQWVNGETDPLSSGMEARPAWRKPDWAGEAAENEEKKDVKAGSRILETRGIRWFQRVYRIMSVVLCLSIILALLWTVSALPPFRSEEHTSELQSLSC